MRTHFLNQTPFGEGQASAKDKEYLGNPYEDGSVQHRNFEVGRAFGLQNPRGSSVAASRAAKA